MMAVAAPTVVVTGVRKEKTIARAVAAFDSRERAPFRAMVLIGGLGFTGDPQFGAFGPIAQSTT